MNGLAMILSRSRSGHACDRRTAMLVADCIASRYLGLFGDFEAHMRKLRSA